MSPFTAGETEAQKSQVMHREPQVSPGTSHNPNSGGLA